MKTIPLGLAMWVCEGTKSLNRDGARTVEIVNSDKQVIITYLSYLRGLNINESKLKARVQCLKKDVKEQTRIWSKITKIPITRFTKPIIKTNKHRKIRGSIIIRYCSRDLQKYLISESRKFGFLS